MGKCSIFLALGLFVATMLTSCEKEISTNNMIGTWEMVTIVQEVNRYDIDLEMEGYHIHFTNGIFDVWRGSNANSLEFCSWYWIDDSNTFYYMKSSEGYNKLHECTINYIKSNKMQLTFVEKDYPNEKKYKVTCKKRR